MAELDEKIAERNKELARLGAIVCEHEVNLRAAHDAQYAVRQTLRELQYQRDAPKREAALAAELQQLMSDRVGPMRPIGDRVIRTECLGDEIDAIMKRDSLDVGFHGVFGTKSADGRTWFTSGYFAIRSSIDKLTVTTRDIDGVIRPRTTPLVRQDVPVKEVPGGMWVRSFGEEHIQLTYATMIEDLFPGLEWWSTGDKLMPVNAYVNGELVALVMPVRMP